MTDKTLREQFSATKPLGVMVLVSFFMLFLIGNISAGWEWDNVKNYNEQTKTITITNALGLGDDIANITLNSPQNVYVIRGNDRKVAEFTINNLDNYDNVFNDMEFFDIKNSMNKFERDFVYKYKNSLGLVDVNDYEYICVDEKVLVNGTILQSCHQEIIGTHKEERFEWIILDTLKELPKGEITIGVFTDVLPNENIEWIPTLFGVKVEEWASWSASDNIGLITYYKFDEPSGVVVDSVGNYDASNDGATRDVGGKINKSFSFDGTNDFVNVTTPISELVTANAFTISTWVNSTEAADREIIAQGWASDRAILGGIGNSGNSLEYIVVNESGTEVSGTWAKGSVVLQLNTWTHIVFRFNGTGLTSYINGTEVHGANNFVGNIKNSPNPVVIGMLQTGTRYWKGTLDEMAIYNRSLSSTEVLNLYDIQKDGFINGSYTPPDNSPSVTLNSPVNVFNTTTPTINFNCTASDDNGITNVSLLINGTIKQTNSSGINGTNYLFTETLTTGTGLYNWSCQAFDDANQSTTAGVRNFTYSNNLAVAIHYPINAYNSTSSTINFNGTASDDTAIINVTLYINGVLNSTNSSGLNATEYNFTKTFSDGDYNWTYEACDIYDCETATTRNLTIDTISPEINITYPLNTTYRTNYTTTDNVTIQLNWTSSDTHLDACWYYNTTDNVTVTCGDNATIFLPFDQYTFLVYANDTLGNENSTSITATWDWKLYENSYIFSSNTYDTSTETFSINVSSDGTQTILADLVYNGTAYAGTKTGNNNVMEFNRTITLNQTGNVSFYWSFNYGGEIINSSLFYQNVSAINLAYCLGGTTMIYNFTGWNEEDLTRISPYDFFGTFEFWIGDGSRINNFSISNVSISYVAICTDTNHTYYTDAIIQYENTSFVKRSYYLTNDTNSTSSQEIKLFLLNTSISTSFIIDVIDDVQLGIDEAYIYIQRYYPGTDEYHTVEMGRTDSSGSTMGHFEAETEDYRIIVEEDNIIIYQSGTQKIFCRETPCTLTFQTEGGIGTTWEDIGTIDDFDWSLEYNEGTKVFTFDYTDTSGSIGWGRLYVYYEKPDTGKVTICNTTSSLLADTITCDVTGYNGTIYAESYLSRSPEILVYLRSIVISALKQIFSFEGLFLMMFVLLVLGLAGLWNPAVGIILTLGGIIIINIIGIASFGTVTVWGLVIIGLILLWELKT